jgi:hypothetical protein
LGDLPQVLGIPTHEVQLHNANARFQILKEGEFDQKWLPALTAGADFKYNEQPRDYAAIGSLVQKESDWWTLEAGYVVNNHFTIAAGYGSFGRVLNHEANGVWGITTKWEF